MKTKKKRIEINKQINNLWVKEEKKKLESILKIRDIILPTKVYIVKVMVFPVVMYECESWTIRKAEH